MISKQITRFKSGIYKITNLVNDKSYIGSSINIYNRKHTHSTKLKNNNHSNKHLQAAYIKYGSDEFIFEVLEYCEKDKLVERENYYINLIKPEYNTRIEAENNLGLACSENTKSLISQTLKEKYNKGEIKAYSQTHKQKEVEQYEMNGKYVTTYKSPKEAELTLGMSAGDVSKAVKETSSHRYNYQWKYKNSEKEIRDHREIIVTNINNNISKQFSKLAYFCIAKKFPYNDVKKAFDCNELYLNTYKIEVRSPV